MTGRDPLEQVEDFLTEVETHIAAEQIKTQAEMILVTALTGKPVLQGQLLADVQEQGPEQYLLDTNCGSTADNFAHYVARKILGIQDVRLADEVRREMHEFFHEATPVEWGRFTVHLIHLFRELVDGVLDIKNGDYHGEST